MAGRQAEVVLAANQHVLDEFDVASLERLRTLATVRLGRFDLPSSWDTSPPEDPTARERLIALIGEADALVIGHGAPRIDAEVLDARPGVRFVGELEGDRFARRIDLEAAWERGVRTVDTTNGTSYGVAEWALALALIGLRGGGALVRRMVVDRAEGFDSDFLEGRGYRSGELSGATVGLIGCGIIGRRLLDLLEPFGCEVFVHDPYVPRELADAYGVTFTSLEQVMSLGEVVVCLAPLTPATRGLLDARAFGLMRDDAVFVNVGRGAVVQSDALVAELQRGRIHACLDVFEPEPIPADAPIRDLPNAFLTPHIAGETVASRRRLYSIMVDELERYFGGHETRFDLSPSTVANRSGLVPPHRG
jgi:phosphoglycerate dehydrogenase-like enzyme